MTLEILLIAGAAFIVGLLTGLLLARLEVYACANDGEPLRIGTRRYKVVRTI
jgi:uncharacterized membrane-anchored protein YhcB (DUF1043 family)